MTDLVTRTPRGRHASVTSRKPVDELLSGPVEQVIVGTREGAARPLPSMRRRQIREAVIEAVITLVALTGIAAVVLIFVFVAREALPLFTSPEARAETDLARMFLPQAWREGRPAFFSWQPVSDVPKYSMVPLFVGTLEGDRRRDARGGADRHRRGDLHLRVRAAGACARC